MRVVTFHAMPLCNRSRERQSFLVLGERSGAQIFLPVFLSDGQQRVPLGLNSLPRRIMGHAVFLPSAGPRVVSASATYGSPEGASTLFSSSSPQVRQHTLLLLTFLSIPYDLRQGR